MLDYISSYDICHKFVNLLLTELYFGQVIKYIINKKRF